MLAQIFGINLPIWPLIFAASIIVAAGVVYYFRAAIMKTRGWIFLTEVNKELHNVTWPTKDDVVNSTIVVIVTTIIVALFIFAGNRIIELTFTLLRNGASKLLGG